MKMNRLERVDHGLAVFGVDLTNVNTITIGVGTKSVPAPGGGQGTMYFDDIRLHR